jgi:hypothetical protein
MNFSLQKVLFYLQYGLIYPLWTYMCCDIIVKFIKNVLRNARRLLKYQSQRRKRSSSFSFFQQKLTTNGDFKNAEIIDDNSTEIFKVETNNNKNDKTYKNLINEIQLPNKVPATSHLQKSNTVRLLKQMYEDRHHQSESSLEKAFLMSLRRRNSDDIKFYVPPNNHINPNDNDWMNSVKEADLVEEIMCDSSNNIKPKNHFKVNIKTLTNNFEFKNNQKYSEEKDDSLLSMEQQQEENYKQNKNVNGYIKQPSKNIDESNQEEINSMKNKTNSLINKFEANKKSNKCIPFENDEMQTADSGGSTVKNSTFTEDESNIFKDVHIRKVVTSMTQLFEKQKPKLKTYVRSDRMNVERIVNLMKMSKDERNSKIKYGNAAGGMLSYFQDSRENLIKPETKTYEPKFEKVLPENDKTMAEEAEDVPQIREGGGNVSSTDEILRSQRFSRNLSEYSISDYLDDRDYQNLTDIDYLITPEPPIVPVNLRRAKTPRKSSDRDSLKRLSQYSLNDLFDKIDESAETSENLEELKKLADQFHRLSENSDVPDFPRSPTIDIPKLRKRPISMYAGDQVRSRHPKVHHLSMENLSTQTNGGPHLSVHTGIRSKNLSNERLYRKVLGRSSDSLLSLSQPDSLCEEQVQNLFNYIIDHKDVQSVEQIINDETFSRDFSEYSISDLLDTPEPGGSKNDSILSDHDSTT